MSWSRRREHVTSLKIMLGGCLSPRVNVKEEVGNGGQLTERRKRLLSLKKKAEGKIKRDRAKICTRIESFRCEMFFEIKCCLH